MTSVGELNAEGEEEEEEVRRVRDRWPVPEDFYYRSRFMLVYSKYLSEMSRLEKDVIDYCLFNNPNNSGYVFKYEGLIYVTYDAIRTLSDTKMIEGTIIDAMALILNKSEKTFGIQRSLSFSSQHSGYIRGVFDGKDLEDKIIDVWEYWLIKLNMKCSDLFNIHRIFVPICSDFHFVCVVINFIDKKIHYLNNQQTAIHPKDTHFKLAKVVAQQMGVYLERINHPKADEYKSYEIELTAFNFKTERNIDCGVCIVHQMENFVGAAYECEELYEALERKKLRAKICSRIVFSSLNGLRLKVTNDALTYITKNQIYKKHMLKKRRLGSEEHVV